MSSRLLLPFLAFAVLLGCTQEPTEAPQDMIEAARNDLATYLQVSPDDIHLMHSRSVTWSDGAIGCAQTGAAYDDAEVPGYIILLTTGGAVANYHQGGDEPPFLCLRPTE